MENSRSRIILALAASSLIVTAAAMSWGQDAGQALIILEIGELGCNQVRVDGFNYSRGETTSLIAVRTASCTGLETEP